MGYRTDFERENVNAENINLYILENESEDVNLVKCNSD